jgi:hypothetical protein
MGTRMRHHQLLFKTVTSRLDTYRSLLSTCFRHSYTVAKIQPYVHTPFVPQGCLHKVWRTFAPKVDELYHCCYKGLILRTYKKGNKQKGCYACLSLRYSYSKCKWQSCIGLQGKLYYPHVIENVSKFFLSIISHYEIYIDLSANQ